MKKNGGILQGQGQAMAMAMAMAIDRRVSRGTVHSKNVGLGKRMCSTTPNVGSPGTGGLFAFGGGDEKGRECFRMGTDEDAWMGLSECVG